MTQNPDLSGPQRLCLAKVLISGPCTIREWDDRYEIGRSLVDLGYLDRYDYGPSLRVRMTPEGVLALVGSK